MRRAPQRRDPGRHRCIGIGAGGTDQPHGRSGRVLLVIRMQDEQQIQCLGRDRVHLQRLAGHFEHHVQETVNVFEIVARIAHRPADRVAIARRGNRRHLGDQADRRQLAVGSIIDVGAVVVERRQRRDRGASIAIGCASWWKALEKVLLRLVHHRVMRDVVLEAGELLLVRQLAIEQQIRYLEEARLLRQLFDRIAAVQQHALVAVDEGDGALGACGAAETRVVGEVAGVLVQRADVDAGRAERAAEQRQFAAALGRLVHQFDGLGVGHGNLLTCEYGRDTARRGMPSSAPRTWRKRVA